MAGRARRIVPERPYEPRDGKLSAAEIYRIACTPRVLPENFADSLLSYILHMEDEYLVHDRERQNFYSPDWGVALRSAVGEAAEWLALSSYESDKVLEKSDPQYDQKVWSETYFRAGQHEKSYCASTLLRRVAQNLCRHAVPEEERVL